MSKSVYFSEAFVLEIFRNGIFSTEIKNSLIVGTYRNKVDQILKFIKNTVTCYKICIISKNICPHV
jgi:hypothetical protein